MTSPDITSSLKIGLEYNGFEVDPFQDPVKALSNFKSGSYDLDTYRRIRSALVCLLVG
jgi:DNA-binding response OmpR family regulator